MDVNRTRNRIANAVSNWVLNTFATRDYNDKLKFTYVLGIAEMARRDEANKTKAMLNSEDPR